jgi:porin
MNKYLLIITFLFITVNTSEIYAQESGDKLKSLLEVENVYTGEFFSNLSGGMYKKGSRYRGNYDLTLTFDFEKAGIWKGGSFFIYFENGHGESITEKYVGDLQVLSNLDAPDFYQISEYYYTQSLSDDRLLLKLGKQNGNADFCFTENGLDFINSSFGIMPNVRMPIFPNPALGVSAFFNASEKLSIGGGIYDGAGSGKQWGFNTAFGSDAVSFSVVEFGYGYSKSSRGKIKLGVWRHGGDYQVIAGTGSKSSCMGSYLIIDQGIAGNQESGGFNLDSFLQYGYSESKVNEIPNYFGCGLKASGFFSNRRDDLLGIGLATAFVNKDIPGMNAETSLELYYKAPIFDLFTVQPDFQYIINPGGTGDNSFVAGMRFYIAI